MQERKGCSPNGLQKQISNVTFFLRKKKEEEEEEIEEIIIVVD